MVIFQRKTTTPVKSHILVGKMTPQCFTFQDILADFTALPLGGEGLQRFKKPRKSRMFRAWQNEEVTEIIRNK